MVYGYSFILTDLDVFTPGKTAAGEHWYRHRTKVENIRDAKHGAALRHLPEISASQPGMDVGALIVTSRAGW